LSENEDRGKGIYFSPTFPFYLLLLLNVSK
jgi:hypothetical protein